MTCDLTDLIGDCLRCGANRTLDVGGVCADELACAIDFRLLHNGGNIIMARADALIAHYADKRRAALARHRAELADIEESERRALALVKADYCLERRLGEPCFADCPCADGGRRTLAAAG